MVIRVSGEIFKTLRDEHANLSTHRRTNSTKISTLTVSTIILRYIDNATSLEGLGVL